MPTVYKICAKADWQAAELQGDYAGSAGDRRDGFIHLSAGDQLQGTLQRHFAGQAGLVLIAFDAEGLDGLKWEPSRGGALFPHVYGNISPAKAHWVKDLPLIDGRHHLPGGLAP